MIATLIAAAALAPQPGTLKTFKDWTVGCDNVRSCHATSLMSEDGDWERMAGMSIKREAGSLALPVIEFLIEGTPRSLNVDGSKLAVRIAPVGDGYGIALRDAAAGVSTLRAGTRLDFADETGALLGSISLAGLSATLLYIDEQQKRLGTVTALARPGPRPASAVPAAPLLPRIRSAAGPGSKIEPDAVLIQALRREHGCVPEEKDWPGYDHEVEAIDARHSLLLLGCGAGAYNFSSVPILVWREAGKLRAKLAGFDLPPRWGEEGSPPALVNASWGEGILTSFAKGRGIGDCGIGSDYAWDGSRFRLVRQIEMGECRGSVDYITTWRAEVTKL